MCKIMLTEQTMKSGSLGIVVAQLVEQLLKTPEV